MARKCRLGAALVCLLVVGGSVASAADNLTKHHALSLVSSPKYGADFKHFDWVNPNAPKGGRVRQWVMGSFDTLNRFPDNKGRPAAAVDLIYDRLMASSPDEPATAYGHIADWVSYPADFSSATVHLRASARFHDGKPITADDVIFSLTELKKVSHFYGAYYKNVLGAEKTGDHEVTFRFDVKGNRELPMIITELPVLPKHYWQGTGANGEPRDLGKSTLEIPLGSGPYRIKHIDVGRSITYERVKDWWAKDLPASKGQWNFDEIKFVYYLNKISACEDFKAGNLEYWFESSAKDWATAFDFDAVKRGLVKRHEVLIKRVQSMQGFALNLRRPQFQDVRVREAFNLALNFEFINKNLFYEQYARAESFFGNSDLQATGLPEGRELEILKELADKVPPEVFTTEYKNPVNATPEDVRKHLSQATNLLADAGWQVKNGVLTNAAGAQLTAEFLLVQPDFERVVLPYKNTLERLGIKATVRTVDTSQYQRRHDTFDYDIVVASFGQSLSPGNEQRDFWGSAAADREGSRNVIGIKNPAIDVLIDKIVLAKDRADLAAATRALDRVLLWNRYVVPQWRAPTDRIAIWDTFGRPAELPSQTEAFLQVWWYDDAAAKRLGESRG
ncbi:MAG: ABC transporter substrate-binding protein [Alphaproteobacteria bacterium]|nr:MAG: ABC transporter substrate-binding protein [Alphaproteobacteria bacterium]